MQSVGKKIIWTVLVSSLLLAEGFATNAMACNYYASPNGGGNGSSPSSPFKISNFWSVAGPGKTLCLLDGVYTGASSMIRPPQNLNGTASARIVIKALNDGTVRINGEGLNSPVVLQNNDYFTLEGFNAHNSATGVVVLNPGADNNVVRRVVAWDAPDSTNFQVYSIVSNSGNLLEDVAGFGKGRKIFQYYSASGPFTIRRAWGMWERSIVTGPKMTFSSQYDSANATYENVIGTWDETAMGGVAVDQPYGILAMDGAPSNECRNINYLGSIGYIRGAQKAASFLGIARSSDDVDCMTFKDVVSYIEPGTHTNLMPFNLRALNLAWQPARKQIMAVTTEIGGKASSIGNTWQISGRVVASNVGTAPNIWNGAGSNGARVCRRYVNGTLTSTPLWPWPMNQRIIDAMKVAGKTPVDVTRTMEEIFGPIPSECRGDNSSSSSTTTSVPTSPSNLSAQ